MSREDIPWLGFAILLLLGGLFIGQRFVIAPQDEQCTENSHRQFGQWFWTGRALDLAVQAGLILACALGIVALLPRDKEDRSE